TIFAVPPSALNSLLSVFWKGVGLRSAAGNQIRVTPDGFSTSTLVVTSKLRHPSASVPDANRRPTLGKTMAADATLVERRKSRRFITPPCRPHAPLKIYGHHKIPLSPHLINIAPCQLRRFHLPSKSIGLWRSMQEILVRTGI